MNKIVNVKAGFTPAFTMIELIFVIVVIGILSAIAIPKLAVSRDDAVLVKAKSQIAAIRSGIAMQKSKRLLEGNTTALPNLDNVVAADYGKDDQRLFNFSDGNSSNVLEYPIYSKQNHNCSWVKSGDNEYKISIDNKLIKFTYSPSNGAIFDCNKTTGAPNIDICKDLTK